MWRNCTAVEFSAKHTGLCMNTKANNPSFFCSICYARSPKYTFHVTTRTLLKASWRLFVQVHSLCDYATSSAHTNNIRVSYMQIKVLSVIIVMISHSHIIMGYGIHFPALLFSHAHELKKCRFSNRQNKLLYIK